MTNNNNGKDLMIEDIRVDVVQAGDPRDSNTGTYRATLGFLPFYLQEGVEVKQVPKLYVAHGASKEEATDDLIDCLVDTLKALKYNKSVKVPVKCACDEDKVKAAYEKGVKDGKEIERFGSIGGAERSTQV